MYAQIIVDKPPVKVFNVRTLNQEAIMETQERITRILSGSCTPACDLQAMVESGEITLMEASNALQRRMGSHRSVAAVADAERADVAARDC